MQQIDNAREAAATAQSGVQPVPTPTANPSRKPGAAVIVAIVAVLGAAGVVGLVPTADVDGVSYAGPASADGAVRVRHADALRVTFNPRTRTPGRRVARITFHFSYRFSGPVKPEVRVGVRDRIRRDWDKVRDGVLRVLTQQQPGQLQDMARLEVKIATAIDDAVFRDRVASVDKIMFEEMIVQ